MTITVNGREQRFGDGITIAALLRELDLPAAGRGVAVAVDAEVVPRGAWDATALSDGAQVEVVTAVQGG
jgi:sulfur carrier protein